ncbi:M10 family metallopeptidase C-terminal domain-containing protein [Bradyrhizobium ottawaense]|uniref:M10 family metallopeptidase C-terminal domain-containing protein n=1 Tax=Bradyrhizobium ottawaense TaxID=931866 RepID=UPI0027D746AF|nr:M10 family metallopeptidase C-terminal domain-containing protein [Bradyrhizobium ottawaense]GMO70877.1 M10 family metallopeptidase C-terminal domain-containing protein [Bradyrhizobium ottawaense]
MATAVNVSATNNAEIDGLLSGYKWTGTITYSFPDASSDYPNPYYGGSSEPTTSGFASAPTQIQAAVNYAIGLILGYSNADIRYAGTNGADIMIAQSPAANPTAYAYYPGNYAPGGDVWFGTQYNFSLAKLGNYYFTTALHELGHALGLKHSQEAGGPANVAVPGSHDDSEYTVMSYRSYVGGSTTSGYTNEAYGYSQTYMANDILALQTMYGADYTTQSGSTVYTWNPTTGQEFINGVGQLAPGGGVGGSANRIYETVWDGGGVDTYDLSNYTTNLSINLNPGASSVFSSVQLAYLGNGHYASGNVYNAYLYGGDARSYIDNAIGGSGNDAIVGNAIANTLNGGGGNDTITGGAGNDAINGGSGTDTAVYSGSRGNYLVSYSAPTQTFTLTDQRSGLPDGTDTVTGVEYFQFADTKVSAAVFAGPPISIEALGGTSLIEIASNFYMNPIAGGTGPELTFYGSPVVEGQFNAWTPIGAEQTPTGFEIAWQIPGTDQFTIWTTDSGGSFISNTGTIAGNSTALRLTETVFHQDLNGDGTIGIPATTIETFGATSLVSAGGNFYMNPVAGGPVPELTFYGSPVVQGQFNAWTPIGAEQTPTGFEIAWQIPGTDQFTIWTTGSGGSFISNTGTIAGNSTALKLTETVFHQDLNGDGTIGIPATTIETFGATSLVSAGGNFYMNPVAGGAGPKLTFYGSPVVQGQFNAWTPIGAEQTPSGFEIAWQIPGTDQFTIWTTDRNGGFISNTGTMAGNSTGLEQAETVFHQDLNGGGTIGIPATTIETFGATSLVATGGNFYMNPVAGGAGPKLTFYGSPVVQGQFNAWTPIGAEQTTTGFEFAWQVPGTDQFTIWTTDRNGEFVSNSGTMAGHSTTLEQAETIFHQDLNGDGTIGIIGMASKILTHNPGDYFI